MANFTKKAADNIRILAFLCPLLSFPNWLAY